MGHKNKNIFKNLSSIDKSYLLDESVAIEKTNKNDATEVRIDQLVPFKNHPFHVNITDENFRDLVESISEQGVIYPIIVRPVTTGTDQYEIIAGHCRVEACKELGMENIPAKIQEMDDFLATVIMTHTNIGGRDKISISEKAKAYRMCMDQEKHQGKDSGGETAAVIGAGKDSTRQVYRFVRLSYLVSEFLDLLDSGKLSAQVGHELAYISTEGQMALYRFFKDFKQLPNLDQAKQLRAFDQDQPLTYERVVGALVKAPVQKVQNKITFKTKDIASYFEDKTDPEEMTDVIIRLLKKYQAGEIQV
ncbi:ParB/RepB/Spo0J family partition protein [[Clostridium] aminophilum]|uniref:ParB/RepB/Spo0J family partition protein n=1 Tax=[Clostridium] aminophilum TaxID=1526 RepID=UPI003F984B31